MQSATDWLETLSPWPKDGFGTERMIELLERLGDPQRSFRAVHVVGTKGKSTAARRIAATIGGLAYTSPHVSGWHERLQTDADGFEQAVARVRADAPRSEQRSSRRSPPPRSRTSRRAGSSPPRSRPVSAAATTRRT